MKKSFSFLLAFAMILSLLVLPANVHAEEGLVSIDGETYNDLTSISTKINEKSDETKNIKLLNDITIPKECILKLMKVFK